MEKYLLDKINKLSGKPKIAKIISQRGMIEISREVNKYMGSLTRLNTVYNRLCTQKTKRLI